MNCRGFGFGGRETSGAKGSRKRTKAGMYLKKKDMPIYDRPIKVFGRGGGRRFHARDAGKTNPIQLSSLPSIGCSGNWAAFQQIRMWRSIKFSMSLCDTPKHENVLETG